MDLANQEIPSKLIGPRKKTRVVAGVMCHIDQDTGDHLSEVINPTIRGGWIQLELIMKLQLWFGATIDYQNCTIDINERLV